MLRLMASQTEVRKALVGLTALAQRELRKAWGLIDGKSAEQVRDFLMDVVPAIADKYGLAAGALAADWYDEARDSAGAAGRFLAEPAPLPDSTRYEALVRWGVSPLFTPTPDGTLAASLIAGGLQRIVADAHRDTITASVKSDGAAIGYARHASANACAFCALLATRGAVYKSEQSAGRVTGVSLGGKDYKKLRRIGDTAEARASIMAGTKAETVAQGGRKSRASLKQKVGDKYHDHCHCTTVPVFEGQTYEPAPYVQKWADAYKATSASDAKGVLAEMRESLGTS